jgi:hypothetical protein
MSLLPEEKDQTPPGPPLRSHALNYVYVLTTILSTAVVIAVQAYRPLPQRFLVTALALYAVGLLVIVWPTIRTRAQQFTENRHRKAIANRLFRELRHLAEQFFKYLDPAIADTVTYALQQIGQRLDENPEFRGKWTLPWMNTSHLRRLFENFLERLQIVSPSFSIFVALSKEFVDIVAVYHYNFVDEPYERFQRIGFAAIHEGYRKLLSVELESQREGYMAFLRRVQDFSDRCNQETGQKVLLAYFTPLKKIE